MKNLRENYISLRKQNKLDVGFLYEYYTDKCKGDPISFTIFMQAIQFANTEVIFETLDLEFDVTRVYDKNGILMTAF